MANSLIEMDNRLTDFEIAWDKAATICSDIKEGYFSETDPESWFLKTYYNSSEIKMQILLDYLYTMKESVETLRGLLDREFGKENETAA